MTTRRAERIARNESEFRDLNENLEANVHRGRPHNDFAGFVCECGDQECESIIRLDLSVYESIREDSKLFFVVPGHEAPDVEDVVDEHDGYRVVRKHDDVAQTVHHTHPRTSS